MALPDIKTILYATSLGKHTRPVFRQAVKQAMQNDAKIVMLHVVEPMGEMGHALIQNYVSEDLIKQMHDEGIKEIHKNMQERIEKFCADEMQSLENPVVLNVEHKVAEGNHTDSILDAAQAVNADMIVMGAENRFGHHSHTSQQVMRHAKIPVLVVPTGKEFD
ncbi:universal stress protein [Neptuniibacter caesariensis]|uniref:Universal stress protein family protein n=1 Tax=Neptuniibacter caesariensis TaxID=207954 RepID=A0A7U8C4W0_NEPCE|nr:universal stress protein [Neptuniibacter caesariensis]EAR60796.1 universal stress protein family protein [Oceanospirillum sp. MED92] [Neptuniibacter caesariensis]